MTRGESTPPPPLPPPPPPKFADSCRVWAPPPPKGLMYQAKRHRTHPNTYFALKQRKLQLEKSSFREKFHIIFISKTSPPCDGFFLPSAVAFSQRASRRFATGFCETHPIFRPFPWVSPSHLPRKINRNDCPQCHVSPAHWGWDLSESRGCEV